MTEATQIEALKERLAWARNLLVVLAEEVELINDQLNNDDAEIAAERLQQLEEERNTMIEAMPVAQEAADKTESELAELQDAA